MKKQRFLIVGVLCLVAAFVIILLNGCTVIKREYHVSMFCSGESACEIDNELLLENLDTETSPTNAPEVDVSPTVDVAP